MRFVIFVMIPLTIFAYELKIGREVIFPDGVSPTFSDLRTILIVVSDYLGIPPPRVDPFENSLTFNSRTLKISESASVVEIESLLTFFEIPFTREDHSLIVPECVIEKIEFKNRSLRVEYRGNPAFVYSKNGSVLRVKSMGYVYMNGKIFKPGDVLFEREIPGLKIGPLVESMNTDVLKLEKYVKADVLILEDFGEWKGKPIGSGSILVEFGRGDGRIIIRPFSKDLAGFDRSVFEKNLDLARELSKTLGYSLEICPVIDLPVGGRAILILMKKSDDMRRILEAVKGMIDFEVVDDRIDSISTHSGMQ